MTPLDRMTLERDLWQKLAEARAGILTAYRMGRQPSDKNLDAALNAVRHLRELEDS